MSKISSVAEFWDLLQGARGTQSYEFSRMHAQFLLCRETPFLAIFCIVNIAKPNRQVVLINLQRECIPIIGSYSSKVKEEKFGDQSNI